MLPLCPRLLTVSWDTQAHKRLHVPEGVRRLMIVMNKARRGRRLTARCKRGRRMCCVRTERVQKSNSAFMDTDEPIIFRGLDHTTACAVYHSLSKHTEDALPLCVQERERGRGVFSCPVDYMHCQSNYKQQFHINPFQRGLSFLFFFF